MMHGLDVFVTLIPLMARVFVMVAGGSELVIELSG